MEEKRKKEVIKDTKKKKQNEMLLPQLFKKSFHLSNGPLQFFKLDYVFFKIDFRVTTSPQNSVLKTNYRLCLFQTLVSC